VPEKAFCLIVPQQVKLSEFEFVGVVIGVSNTPPIKNSHGALLH
jgi:hypothetical protein